MGRFLDLDYHYWHQTKQVSRPYSAYMPGLIHGWIPEATPEARESLERAERRLADVDATIRAGPTLRWCLSRAEGIATSSVEGINTTFRSLSLLDSLRGQRRPGTDIRDIQVRGSVLMNSRALALASGEQVAVGDIERLHRDLFTDTEHQHDAGRLRREQVWVGSGQRTPVGAHYVPPPHLEVPKLMDDFTAFLSDRSAWMPPIAKATLAHAQFETIHPFTDGNGRIGRALMHLVLRRNGPRRVAVPLSAAINARRDAYYASLRPYQTYLGEARAPERGEALSASLAYTADAVTVACDYAETASRTVEQWERRCTAARLRNRSAAGEMLAAMAECPAVTVPALVERTGRPTRTVSRALRTLIDVGLLTESREPESGVRVLENSAVLAIVDRRHDLLEAAWENRLAGNDNPVPFMLDAANEHLRLASGNAATNATQNPRCGHVGVRSRKPCVRRAGHHGAHSY